MAASLVGVRAKIQRAEQHLEELKVALNDWVAANRAPTVLRTEEQPDGKQVFFDLSAADPPPSCSLHLGDAVHNLRSALDHLVCQLAVAAGNSAACDRTQFPMFCDDTPENRKTIQRRIKATGRAAAAIEDLQPYKRRPQDPYSDLLWLLSELDNIDKHRLLLVVNQKISDGLVRFQIGDEIKFLALSKVSKFIPLKLGAIPFRLTLKGAAAKREVKVDAQATFGVVFTQTGLKCDGAEIIPTLRSIIADVKAIVDDFESRFF